MAILFLLKLLLQPIVTYYDKKRVPFDVSLCILYTFIFRNSFWSD